MTPKHAIGQMTNSEITAFKTSLESEIENAATDDPHLSAMRDRLAEVNNEIAARRRTGQAFAPTTRAS